MVHSFIALGPCLQAVDNVKLYLSVYDEYKTCVSSLLNPSVFHSEQEDLISCCTKWI